jgi:putative lipoic acid-binding regulatory protein
MMLLLSFGSNNRNRQAIYLVVLFVILSSLEGGHSFHASTAVKNIKRPSQRLHSNFNNDEQNDETSIVPPAVVTIDDGGDGSDLTNRFKYKVHALMGTYDAPSGVVDDENQMGNILDKMLQFPTKYTFSVVGKTENINHGEYANEVELALISVLGCNAQVEMMVVPRGKKFTKVTATVTVDSASVISYIYDKLEALDATVMKF